MLPTLIRSGFPAAFRRSFTTTAIKMVNQVNSSSEFTELVAKDIVFVDFFATWCGPCKAIAPALDALESKYPSIKFAKLDIEQVPEITSKFQIQSVPTLILFKDGEQVEVIKGANIQKIREVLEKYK